MRIVVVLSWLENLPITFQSSDGVRFVERRVAATKKETPNPKLSPNQFQVLASPLLMLTRKTLNSIRKTPYLPTWPGQPEERRVTE